MSTRSDVPPDGLRIPASEEQTWDAIVAADTPDDMLPGSLPGAPVMFRGNMPLSRNPSTNNLTAPLRLLQHPLVKERYFFTLPGGLWDETCHRLGAQTFDPELCELEDELGATCGDPATSAGLWRGRAFPYHHLHRTKLPKISAAEMGWKIPQAQLELRLRAAEERASGIARTARGYLGWLLLNPQFIDEHDELIQTHETVIARWGTANFGLPVPPPGFDELPATLQDAFHAADARFVEFFCRWRLHGLAAPYLPNPLQPLLAGRMPTIELQRHLQTGGLFVVPDTFPVPSRDEFRGMLDDALHSSPPSHLAEWMKLIAAGNTGKQAIVRFARLFELQHYWRVLHSRHPHPLRRRSTLLKEALASFLQVNEKAVHRDLIEIRRRLGKSWLDRGAGFKLGPF